MSVSSGTQFPSSVNVGHLHFRSDQGLYYRYLGDSPFDPLNWAVFGGAISGDPSTIGWTIKQDGAWWFNKTENVIKFWDGQSIAVLGDAADVSEAIAQLPINAVVDFNADNTGASNTSFQLQEAINDAIATGRPLYIPPGTYDCGGTALTVNGTVTIYGAGRKTIIRKSVDANTQLFLVTGNNVLLRDFHCEYTAATTNAHINISALEYNGITGSQVQRITVDGKFYIGIHLNDCVECGVSQCHVKGVVNRSFYISADVATNDIQLSDCIANGAVTGTTPFTSYGFNINMFGTGLGQRLSFTNCLARNFAENGFMPSENCYEQIFANCHAVNCTFYGFIVQLANSKRGRHVAFIGCSASSCLYGFYATSSDYVVISGNQCRGCNIGIYVLDSKNVVITGNVIEQSTNESILVNGTGAGDAANVMVSNNTTNAGTYGINVGANADRVLVVANVALGASTTNIANNGTNSVTANNLNA